MSGKKQSNSLCRLCKFAYKEGRKMCCLAFPDGIPDNYFWYGEEHRQLTGEEKEKYYYSPASMEEFEPYYERGSGWYTLERIKELGHDKKPL